MGAVARRTGDAVLSSIDLLLFPLGLTVGAFGTLVGAGGGFVLVPVLLLLLPGREAQTITAMSLFVVAVNAASGSVAYGRQGRIDVRSALWFASATLPGAVGGAIVVGFIPRSVFDVLFATILGGIGFYLLFHRPSRAIAAPITGRGVVRRRIRDAQGNTFTYAFRLPTGVSLSMLIGFFSSLLGIGGGVIHVPVLVTILHFPVHIATATSQFTLMFMAAEGVAVHFWTGTLTWDRSLFQAAVLAAGAVPGAQLGAWASRRLESGIVLQALAGALVLVAIRLGLKSLA